MSTPTSANRPLDYELASLYATLPPNSPVICALAVRQAYRENSLIVPINAGETAVALYEAYQRDWYEGSDAEALADDVMCVYYGLTNPSAVLTDEQWAEMFVAAYGRYEPAPDDKPIMVYRGVTDSDNRTGLAWCNSRELSAFYATRGQSPRAGGAYRLRVRLRPEQILIDPKALIGRAAGDILVVPGTGDDAVVEAPNATEMTASAISKLSEMPSDSDFFRTAACAVGAGAGMQVQYVWPDAQMYEQFPSTAGFIWPERSRVTADITDGAVDADVD